jgi:Helix-turn-helix domain
MTGQRKQPDASQPRSGTVVDARMSLALWLRTGRTERGLSLGDVARTTKIQARILERLEGGKLDGLPAEVFVRGFIRSFAKCCGLDESEALTRYSAASQAQLTATAPAMPSTLGAPPSARAVVEAMADLAPQIARTTHPKILAPVEAPIEMLDFAAGSLAIPVAAVESMTAEADSEPEIGAEKPLSNRQKKKQRGKKRAKRGTQRAEMATGTPSVPTPIVVERIDVAAEAAVPEVVVEAAPVETAALETATIEEAPVVVDHLDPLVVPADANDDVVATEVWQPKMPGAPVPSAPWRRPAYAASAKAAMAVPTLVIDDADPDSAEQMVEDRAAAKSVLTNAQRRSFLPPILLDREDRSARQGGLTLAVIILLIAATLTLSYLMRRPSSSGDGVTSTDVETQLVG